MSYELYKVLHILGLLTLFTGLVATWAIYLKGKPNPSLRKQLAWFHGIGLLIMLITGFGMLARLGFMAHMPGWAYAKMGIWVILGGSTALAKRKANWGLPLLTVWILLGVTAAYFAILKPF